MSRPRNYPDPDSPVIATHGDLACLVKRIEVIETKLADEARYSTAVANQMRRDLAKHGAAPRMKQSDWNGFAEGT